MADELLVERRGRVLLITLNRPHVRNAVNQALATQLAQAVDELDQSPDLAVAVLCGVRPGFCAGMDLDAFLAGETMNAGDRGFAGIVDRPPEKPMIAAVDGFAVAGGVEILLACDLIVAAEDAWLSIPEVQRGLMAVGTLHRIATRMPFHAALDWALTGDRMPATRAAELGLVTRLAPAGAALEVALGVAERIAGNAPLALAATKQILRAAPGWAAAEAAQREHELADPVFASDDAREGASAFREKRAPRWTGA